MEAQTRAVGLHTPAAAPANAIRSGSNGEQPFVIKSGCSRVTDTLPATATSLHTETSVLTTRRAPNGETASRKRKAASVIAPFAQASSLRASLPYATQPINLTPTNPGR